jgi:hypothetical protein
LSRRVERSFEGRTVTVHTFQGPSFQGVLFKAGRDAWLLASVTDLDHDAKLAGQVAIPRSNGVLQVD